MPNYEQTAADARKKILELIYKAQTSHIASNFSAIDIMAVLFDRLDLDKDRFVLSKGWAACALYYSLWKKGRITDEELNSYCQPGSKWIGLSEPVHKDIKIAGGSMGLGLPGAVGLALAKKLKNEEGKVYVLMSDGELQCGTTWESILIAGHHKLDNLIVLVDYNGLQAMGKTEDILRFPNITMGQWKELGWDGAGWPGHDYKWIEEAIKPRTRPIINFMNTIKGKGVSFMENKLEWHYKSPNEKEYKQALKELNE